MSKQNGTIELEQVVVKFAGDSGDGMQLTGTQFTDTSALLGNDLATFPDFPAEIRAPQGTVPGVSGFQVHIGNTEINTPGDIADVLVAMNPAALKANKNSIKKGGTIIVNIDSFEKRDLDGHVKSEIKFLLEKKEEVTKEELKKVIKEETVKKTTEQISRLDSLGFVWKVK